MRRLALLLPLLCAAFGQPSVQVVWVDSSPSTGAPVVQRGILHSCETCAVPASSILLDQNAWNAARSVSITASSPPTVGDRAAVISCLPPMARMWWNSVLVDAHEQDAVIEAWRMSPPW